MYKPHHSISFSSFLLPPPSLSFCCPLPFVRFSFLPFFLPGKFDHFSYLPGSAATMLLQFVFQPYFRTFQIAFSKSIVYLQRILSGEPCSIRSSLCGDVSNQKKNFIPFMSKQIEFTIKLSHCDRLGIKDKCLDFFKWCTSR